LDTTTSHSSTYEKIAKLDPCEHLFFMECIIPWTTNHNNNRCSILFSRFLRDEKGENMIIMKCEENKYFRGPYYLGM